MNAYTRINTYIGADVGSIASALMTGMYLSRRAKRDRAEVVSHSQMDREKALPE